MPSEAAKIDRRTATAVEAELREELTKLRGRDRAWENFEPGVGLSRAMIGIFSRLAEIIIRRLNEVPEKNFLAFLDLLGASLLPPQPARVPLTFTLAAGGTTDSVVPAGTQAAAPPAEGEKEPIIYETERELVVTAARLDSVFVREPEQDRFADLRGLLAAPAPGGSPAFAGDRHIEHIFYVGHDEYFGLPALKEVRLSIALTSDIEPDPRELEWEIWVGTRFMPFGTSSDTTDKLTDSGDVTFSAPVMTDNSPFPRLEVGGVESRWMRCRLLTPITTTASPDELQTMVRESKLPTILSVGVQVRVDSRVDGLNQRLPPDAAFSDALPLDTTKDFLPFGESPRYNDTFYVANREAFSKAGAEITLTVSSTDPASAGIKTPAANAELRLRWEYWNGEKWAELATVDKTGVVNIPQSYPQAVKDTTAALTTTGKVEFILPTDAAATTVNGVENFWVRARIVAGNYGVPPRYDPVEDSGVIKGYKTNPGTLAPPSLSLLGVDYSLLTEKRPADAVVTYNDFREESVGGRAFKPFRATADKEPTLYLGFSLPPPRTEFPNRKLSLFADVVDFKHGEKYGPLWPRRSKKAGGARSTVSHKFWLTNENVPTTKLVLDVYGSAWTSPETRRIELSGGKTTELNVSVPVPAVAARGDRDRGFIRLKADKSFIRLRSGEADDFEYGATFETFAAEEVADKRPQLSWEYWDGESWAALATRDDSRNFTQPGVVEFIAPADFAARRDFDLDSRFWLRVRWKSGDYGFAPHLSRLLLNTMTAKQSVTIRDELLGSSDASNNQKFRATRAPVLPGERLEVREPEMPSAEDAARIAREEGDDAIRVVRDAAGLAKEIWVRWRAMPDFYSSGPRDRHYVLDRLTGEISFGDGLNGLIPPSLTGNLRLRRYQTGGGAAGNRPAGVITQLKTTVPYIDKVTNFIPATGGADAEDISSLIERAPRTLRHGDRAVTIEDYEDLAKQATPEVARVKCVPLYDLSNDPDATRQRLGVVSLVVVPRSTEARPAPSLELLNRVRDYLDKHRSPSADLFVVGPDYVRVDIEATIGLSSLEGAREVESAVLRTLSRFLHPLTGGLDGKGWDFGRKPHKSDLYALLEDTAGVDHVVSLRVGEFKERADAATTERALVYSGAHKINLTLEEP